jgi:hypothetical protein
MVETLSTIRIFYSAANVDATFFRILDITNNSDIFSS